MRRYLYQISSSLLLLLMMQEPLISDSQPQDKSFILCVEELLSQSPCPEYRQLIVELFVVIASLFERNCEVNITESVALDEVLPLCIAGSRTEIALLILEVVLLNVFCIVSSAFNVLSALLSSKFLWCSNITHSTLG